MTSLEPPSPHVTEELPGLLLGELDRDETVLASRHLRSCASCRADLVDVAVALGSMRAARRVLDDPATTTADHEETEASTASDDPLPPLGALRRPANRRKARIIPAVVGIAAALALFATGIGVGTGVGDGNSKNGSGPTSQPAVLASSTFRPLAADPAASGTVTIAQSEPRVLVVTIHTEGLPAPGRNRFYEAWLLDPSTSKMMAMGVLPPTGSTTFEVAGDLVQGYSSVDISLQVNNGDPAHSDTSVLRAADL